MARRFPAILSGLRRERGLNQRTAAAALNISQALLSHYENGLREPGLAFVDAACAYYGVSADYLLGRSPLRTPLAVHSQAAAPLTELGELGQAALSALLTGLDGAGLDPAETLRDLTAVAAYRLLRPFRPDGEYDIPEALYRPLCDAAIQLSLARLLALGEDGLRFTMPDRVLDLAEAELNVLRDEWR